MNVRLLLRLLLLPALLLTLLLPKASHAADFPLTVEPSPPAGSTTSFPSIQLALNQAQTLIKQNSANTVSITVKPGTYTGSFTPITNVPIVGTSTASTIIAGSGTIVNIGSASAVTNVILRNFTFNAGPSVAVSISNNSSQISLKNIVFNLGKSGTAIQIQNSNSINIINNTFNNNATAINASGAITTLAVTNNIFNDNTTALVTAATPSSFTYNAFYPPSSSGIPFASDPNSLPNTLHPQLSPLFVNPANDFHLQSSSPCKGTGNPSLPNPGTGNTSSDMGAYGGPFADAAASGPAPVTNLVSTVSSPDTPPTTMTLLWDASGSPVTAYRVYYSTSPSVVTAVDGTGAALDSPFVVTTAAARLIFNTLPAVPPAPTGTPVLTLTPSDHSLLLNWTPVLGATGYTIYYNTAGNFNVADLSKNSSTVVPATTLSYQLNGLTNGPTSKYSVAIQPFAKAQISAQVSAVIDATQPSSSTNESTLSTPQVQNVGAPAAGNLSNIATDFPEAAVPFPNVKGGGCFIATAAYGFYSAPQVQSLRLFRDRYLMATPSGRAFVSWYYTHGPRAARYLNAHPWLKAPVRVALLPLVAISAFLVYTSPITKLALLMCAMVTAYFLYARLENRPITGAGRW